MRLRFSRHGASLVIPALASMGVAFALASCSDDEFAPPSTGDAAATADGSSADGASAIDASDASADAPAADVVAPTVYNDFTKTSSWSTFDTSTLVGSPGGFYGGAFDGKYLYLAPYYRLNPSGKTVRYDTTAPFGSASSWEPFDMTTVNAGLVGFRGAVATQNHVYYVPNNTLVSAHGLVTRFDRVQSFTQSAAWSSYDLTQIDTGLRGYAGAVVAKNAIYFVPEELSAAQPHGRVVRYDLNGSFSAPGSFSVFDPSGFYGGAVRFQGALFDGQWIYFVPNQNGFVMRYDTTAPFQSLSSWQTFDLAAQLGAKFQRFAGAVFDGRYVYLAPSDQLDSFGTNVHGNVVRYDTMKSFGTASSWETYDLVANVDANARGSIGIAFDGRYVYLASLMSGTTVRYDTHATFTAASSWQSFDATKVDPKAYNFAGILFDGARVYFLPSASGTMVTRFDAKSPPSMPAGYTGSTL